MPEGRRRGRSNRDFVKVIVWTGDCFELRCTSHRFSRNQIFSYLRGIIWIVYNTSWSVCLKFSNIIITFRSNVSLRQFCIYIIEICDRVLYEREKLHSCRLLYKKKEKCMMDSEQRIVWTVLEKGEAFFESRVSSLDTLSRVKCWFEFLPFVNSMQFFKLSLISRNVLLCIT